MSSNSALSTPTLHFEGSRKASTYATDNKVPKEKHRKYTALQGRCNRYNEHAGAKTTYFTELAAGSMAQACGALELCICNPSYLPYSPSQVPITGSYNIALVLAHSFAEAVISICAAVRTWQSLYAWILQESTQGLVIFVDEHA